MHWFLVARQLGIVVRQPLVAEHGFVKNFTIVAASHTSPAAPPDLILTEYWTAQSTTIT
jgi:hypothetical protein